MLNRLFSPAKKVLPYTIENTINGSLSYTIMIYTFGTNVRAQNAKVLNAAGKLQLEFN